MTGVTEDEVEPPPNVLLSGINGPTAPASKRRPRGPLTWTCSLPECGEVFERVAWKVAHPERPYCSRKCALRHQALLRLPLAGRAEVVERYLAGETTAQLGEAFGIHSTTARLVLIEAGIDTRRGQAGHARWAGRTKCPPDEGNLEEGFRWCLDCRERKPMDDYYWSNKAKTARVRRCKPCFGVHLRSNNKDKRKGHRRKAAYGLMPVQFDRMWQQQNGRCSICRDPLDDARRNGVHVDHCHFDDQVRGLLCGKCNVGLGHFRDDPELLLEAARYLMAEHWHPALESLVVPHGEIPDYVDRWGAP